MTGVILCGGQSSRMGQDKGTMQLNEQNWAQIIANNFIQLNIPFIVSVNAKQTEIYKNKFKEEQLILDNINLPVKGPLLGLLSVHNKFPEENLFVIACDMLDIALPPLQLLLNNYNLQKEFDAYLFAPNNELQPVCAIYTTKLLNVVLNKVKNNELKKFSLKELLKDFNNYVAIPPTEWLYYFNNYNSQEDLNRFNKTNKYR